MIMVTLKYVATLMRADCHLNQRPVCATAQPGLQSRTPKLVSVTSNGPREDLWPQIGKNLADLGRTLARVSDPGMSFEKIC